MYVGRQPIRVVPIIASRNISMHGIYGFFLVTMQIRDHNFWSSCSVGGEVSPCFRSKRVGASVLLPVGINRVVFHDSYMSPIDTPMTRQDLFSSLIPLPFFQFFRTEQRWFSHGCSVRLPLLPCYSSTGILVFFSFCSYSVVTSRFSDPFRDCDIFFLCPCLQTILNRIKVYLKSPRHHMSHS